VQVGFTAFAATRCPRDRRRALDPPVPRSSYWIFRFDAIGRRWRRGSRRERRSSRFRRSARARRRTAGGVQGRAAGGGRDSPPLGARGFGPGGVSAGPRGARRGKRRGKARCASSSGAIADHAIGRELGLGGVSATRALSASEPAQDAGLGLAADPLDGPRAAPEGARGSALRIASSIHCRRGRSWQAPIHRGRRGPSNRPLGGSTR
jgi:hypothetical protein